MNNEPVAWMSSVNGETVYVGYEPADGWLAIPLYTQQSLDEAFEAGRQQGIQQEKAMWELVSLGQEIEK